MSKQVKILEYEKRIKIMDERELLAEYDLPPFGVKRDFVGPKDGSKPFQKPKYHKYFAHEEEKKLRLKGAVINQYLDFIKSASVVHKNKFICELYKLSQRASESLFEQVVKRAFLYKVKSIETLTNIASWMIKVDGNAHFDDFFPSDFKDRKTYQDGKFSGETSIGYYKQLFLGEENESG
jgi:hypothetical protein